MSCLHHAPGWPKSDLLEKGDDIPLHEIDHSGKHCILELYQCDEGKINDEAFIRTILTLASKKAGATLINLITHHFHPQGVTGLALLAESHISIHTWPDSRYAAVDVFTCGDHTMPEKACELIRKELNAQNFKIKSFQREVPITLSKKL
tara:strand:- start:1040 stop:1486 length:447 start_codon:yes stop_codon:yes gene_type:complete